MKIRTDYRKETIEDIPSKKDIEIALKHSNIKYNSIITLMSSSGMRMSDVTALSYEHLLISLQDYTKLPKSIYLPIDVLIDLVGKNKELLLVPTWKFTSIKTNSPSITFSTPESLTYLFDYLKLKPPETLDTPLFRSNKFPTKSISRSGFLRYFYELNKRCGFGKVGSQSKFRSHSLRKYFTTTLYHANINKLTIDWLLSHTVDSVTESYFKSSIPKLKEEYIKVIPDLSIQDTQVHDIKSPEFIQLTNDNKDLRERVKKLEREFKASRYIED
jgi:integrase